MKKNILNILKKKNNSITISILKFLDIDLYSLISKVLQK